MAVHACRMPVIVDQRSLSRIMRVDPGRIRMRNLGELRIYVRDRRRDVRPAVVTGHAVLRRGIEVRYGRLRTTQQPRPCGRVMGHVARQARVLPNRRVAAQHRGIRYRVPSSRVNASRPLCQRIALPIDRARVHFVARQAQLSRWNYPAPGSSSKPYRSSVHAANGNSYTPHRC